MTAPRRVLVTGIGPVTPVGIGREAFWEALTSGRSGISAWEEDLELPVRVVGRVDGLRPEEHMDRKVARRASRFVQLASTAASLAWEDAGGPEVRPDRAGVILASALSGIDRLVEQEQVLTTRGPRRLSAFAIPAVMPNAAPGQVAIDLGLGGLNISIASGDAGSLHALGQAFRYVRDGILDTCLVGGTEAPLVPLVLTALARAGGLTRQRDPAVASRPFDVRRDGFVPAEGACVLVLEEAEHAASRGAEAYAEVAGHAVGGTNGDEAVGAQVIRRALEEAKTEPGLLDVVIAGATSSVEEDRREARILAKALGDGSRVPVSAPRSMTGHLLAASGAVDTAVAALALHAGMAPPTLNLDEPEPDAGLDHVGGTARPIGGDAALVDSLSFDGQHAAVVLRRADGLR